MRPRYVTGGTIMKRIIATLSLTVLALAACKPAPQPTPAASSAAPMSEMASAEPPPPAAKAFVINELADGDGDIEGCITMLSRPSGTASLFFEDGVDDGAKGYMRIDGKLIRVNLTASNRGETGGKRVFASADKALTVTEDYKTGESHPNGDSVDLSGTLTVTYKGLQQSVPFEGGTAC